MASTIKLLNENGKTTTIGSGSNTTDITLDGSKLMYQVDTIVALRGLTETPSTIYVTGYTTANDNAFGSNFYKWNSTSTSSDNGGTIIKLTGTTTGRYELQYSGAINVKWFGFKGIGTTVDTALLQAAFNSGHNIYEIDKASYTLAATVTIASGTVLKANGAIFSPTTTAMTSLFHISNETNIDIYDLRLSGLYYDTIDSLFSITDSQHINIYSMFVTLCKLGINVGDQTSATNSEINFFGIQNFNCVTVLQTQGFNTQAFLTGCIMVGLENANFPTLIAKTVINRGGALHISNSAVLSPTTATGMDFYMTPTDYLQDISGVSAYRYGKISCSNTTLETSGVILKSFDNGKFITAESTTHGAVMFDTCSSYTATDASPYIYTDVGFMDNINVTNCRFIFPTTRTAQNITAMNNTVGINTDNASWIQGFRDYIDGITGGVLLFEKDRVVLNATVLNNLAIGNNVLWSTVWDSIVSGDRHQGDFDGTTYTVPAGGYSNILIVGNLEVTENVVAAVQTVEMHINVDGVVKHKEFSTTAYAGALNIAITASLKDVAAGSLIKLNITPRGAGVTAIASGSYLKMIATV